MERVYGHAPEQDHVARLYLVFGASQAADGMVRVMALVALLQQPEKDLPAVLILDEPELGLHPYAIEVIAGLLRSASLHTQVIMATQSVSLIDRFEPENVVVTERSGRESSFQRLSTGALDAWLDQYTLSELWEKLKNDLVRWMKQDQNPRRVVYHHGRPLL